NAGRIAYPVIGARDYAFPGLDRLAQRIEHLWRKFGKLVEEQYAIMRQRNLPRPHPDAAADHGGHGGGMMGSAKWPPVAQLSVGQFAGNRGDHRNLEQLTRRQ